MADTDPPVTIEHLTRRQRESAARIRKHREAMARVAREVRQQVDDNNGGEVNPQ